MLLHIFYRPTTQPPTESVGNASAYRVALDPTDEGLDLGFTQDGQPDAPQ